MPGADVAWACRGDGANKPTIMASIRERSVHLYSVAAVTTLPHDWTHGPARSSWASWRWPVGLLATFVLWLALVAVVGAATSASGPVFRFYNTATQTHFYTISAAERDQVIARYASFVFEGPVFYAFARTPRCPCMHAWKVYNSNVINMLYSPSRLMRMSFTIILRISSSRWPLYPRPGLPPRP